MHEGLESHVSIPASVVRRSTDGTHFAVRFEEDLTDYFARKRWRILEASGLLLVVVTLAVIAYMRIDSVFYLRFDVPLFLYGLCASVFLISRFAFAMLYRNVPIDPAYTPDVSIIIPCFNEEAHITRTITCALDQDYPPDKLTVIVVDDGSTDSSVKMIQDFKEQTRHLIRDERFKIIVHEKNSGKRHVMATGTRVANSELVIFVDSDSFLEPNAVRELVQPLANPSNGAVCGRCEVENKWTNYLTKMQAVRYFIAFRVFKAAESVFDAVTCLSGPLSCYRRDLVLKHLDPWLNQKFMGRTATFGDDRSLTNFILDEHRVVYQHEAVCSTIVPSTMSQFLRQQMRWKRSWLRESLRAAKFMWRKEIFMAISFYIGLLMHVLAPLVVLRAVVAIPLMYGYLPFHFFLGVFLMSALISATYLILKRSGLWWYGALFCLFYLAVLMWQMIPAMLTFWVSEWGTRDTAEDVAAREKRKIRVADAL